MILCRHNVVEADIRTAVTKVKLGTYLTNGKGKTPKRSLSTKILSSPGTNFAVQYNLPSKPEQTLDILLEQIWINGFKAKLSRNPI